MSLSDRIKRVYQKHHLRPGNGFTENGTFARFDALDSFKPITTSVTALSSENESDESREQTESIEVEFMLDDIRGILYEGDIYVRDPKFDPDERPFRFSGRYTERGEHHTRAIFERLTRHAQGQGVL